MRLFAVALLALSLTLPATAQDEPAYPEYTVSSDLSALPEAVRKTRDALIAAALTGDIEALRPIVEAQAYPPTVSYGGPDDAVDYLKTYSADGQGIENLAIMLELLNAPYAVFDSASDNPSYVWPYLAVVEDLSALTPKESSMPIASSRPSSFRNWWTSRPGITGASISTRTESGRRLSRGTDPQPSGNASRNRIGCPIDGVTSSPCHITVLPRTIVPTGQPVTVTPS